MTRFSDEKRYSNGALEQSVGSKCKSKVDLYNGALTVTLDDISFNYGSPKLSIGHVYKSNATDGNNWKLNLEQKIVVGTAQVFLVNADGVKTKYTQIYSNKLYLSNKEIQYDAVYINEDSTVGGIYKDESNNSFVMFDEKDNFTRFEYVGGEYRLRRMKNASNEEVLISYDGNGRITSVSDSYGRSINCIYENGVISKITDSTGERELNFVCQSTSSGKYYVTEVWRKLLKSNSSEKIYTFEYTSAMKLKSIEDEAKRKLSFIYSAETGAITYVEESWTYDKITSNGTQGATTKIGNSCEIHYGGTEDYPTTTVITNSGINETHHFATENDELYYKKVSYEGAFGAPKNGIRGKLSLHGNSIKAQIANDNVLRNGTFTELDSSSASGMKNWSYTANGEENIISTAGIPHVYGSVVASFGGTSEHVLTQRIVGVDTATEKLTLEGGALTLMAWLKCESEFDKCSFKLKVNYENGASSETLDFNDKNPVGVHVGVWQCFMGSAMVAGTKKNVYQEDCKISSLDFIMEYKGKTNTDKLFVNGIALMKNSTVGWSEHSIKYLRDGEICTRNLSEVIFSPDEAYVTQAELYNPRFFIEAYKNATGTNANKRIKFIGGTASDEVLVNDTEIVYGGMVIAEDSGMIVGTKNDPVLLPEYTLAWNHNVETKESNAFKTTMSYDDKFRQTLSVDYRNIATETIYTDKTATSSDDKTPVLSTETKKYKVVNSGSMSGRTISSGTENTLDGGAVKSETDERGKITTYSYKENESDTELQKDKQYSVTLPNGTTYSYKYDERGNVSEMICGDQSFKYEYTLGLQTKIIANDTDEFEYDYDGQGNVIAIRHNDELIYSAEYKTNGAYYDVDDVNYKQVTKNGKTYKSVMDKYGNITSVYEISGTESTKILDCEYNDDTHEMTKMTDYTSGTACAWDFVSNTKGGINKVVYSTGATEHDYESVKSYEHEILLRDHKTIGFTSLDEQYAYDTDSVKGMYPDRRIKTKEILDGQNVQLAKIQYSYDDLGRPISSYLSQKVTGSERGMMQVNYDYENVGMKTSNTVAAHRLVYNGASGTKAINHLFTYDDNGNIVKDVCGNKTTEYFYDTYDRLIREDRYTTSGSVKTGTTTVFVYDEKGNILGKQELTYDEDRVVEYTPTELVSRGNIASDSLFSGEAYSETATNLGIYELNGKVFTPYEYDSNGRIVKAGDKIITYDSLGRPTTYNGNTLIWDGSKLTKFGDYTMEYDCRGYRTKKTSGNLSHLYKYDEQGNLVQEIRKNGSTTTDTVTYLYDTSGVIGFALSYNNAGVQQKPFYYVKDLLGNICEIIDNNGNYIVKYTYDAWGNIVNTESNADYLLTLGSKTYTAYNIASLNAFAYRGYYYDKDLELFYLINRYYDSTIGRFISPDDPKYLDFEVLFGFNTYAYCNNNPIAGYDPEGTWNWGNFWKSVGVVAAAVVVIAAITAATVFTAGVAAAALGASTAVVSAVVTGAAIGGTVAGVSSVVDTAIDKGGLHNIQPEDMGTLVFDTFVGGVSGAISGAAGYGLTTAFRSAGKFVKYGARFIANLAGSATGGLLEGVRNPSDWLDINDIGIDIASAGISSFFLGKWESVASSICSVLEAIFV